MKSIRDVVLELVRPGPAHNQLLSPLTTYIALCGGNSPINVHMPFEHHQLLMRIQRLRYELAVGTPTEAQIAQRQAELQDMGKLLGDVLGEIPALLAELSRARCDGGKLAHVRLSLSATELSMVPFETALSPAGFPGNGAPLFLQSHTPVCITREIRRGQQLPLQWNQSPKILFVFASPPGLAPVPAEAHLSALRDAITPWVKIKDTPEENWEEIKKLLTVLPDASLQEIREHCVREHYTHVHILAHGDQFDNAGDRRFGVALCKDGDKSSWDVVDGESLAIALTYKSASGNAKFPPTVVSLATCDSGNVNSVITPGGSIAHELHAAGIPWVIASQFPLWMKASILMARELFSGLLEGIDPRWVLYTLRLKLRTDCPTTHDWASIVAYATVPPDFENQVKQFRDQQTRDKISVQLDRLDDLFGVNKPFDPTFKPGDVQIAELKSLKKSMRKTIDCWLREADDDPNQRFKVVASDRLGFSGACEKRIGIAYQLVHQSYPDDPRYSDAEKAYLDAYRMSREHYLQAVEANPTSSWPITQFLAMHAVPKAGKEELTPFEIPVQDWHFIGTRLASTEIDTPRGAYARADLVELQILGSFYNSPFDANAAKEQIKKYLKALKIRRDCDRIPVIALRRQLLRYQGYWKDKRWDDLVESALATLNDDAPGEDMANEMSTASG